MLLKYRALILLILFSFTCIHFSAISVDSLKLEQSPIADYQRLLNRYLKLMEKILNNPQMTHSKKTEAEQILLNRFWDEIKHKNKNLQSDYWYLRPGR